MNLKEQLLAFYVAILRSIGYVADDQGLISRDFMGKISPATDDKGRRICIPTDQILRASRWDELQAFHPLCESSLRGESPILRKMRAYINFRLTATLSILMSELMDIATDASKHKRLSPSAAEFLKLLPEVDDKTNTALLDVLKGIEYNGKNRLVSVYLKRGGILNGMTFQRTAITSFPITDEFDTDETVIYGVKMRVKDKKAIEDLMNWILPGCNDFEAYSFGSLSSTAPYFHALMGAYLKVIKRINFTVEKFNRNGTNLLECFNDVYVDLSWEEQLKDLARYRDVIPPLEGNEGEADTTRPQAASPAVPSYAPPVNTPPANTAPNVPSYAPPAPTQQPQQQQPEPNVLRTPRTGFGGSPGIRNEYINPAAGNVYNPAMREQMLKQTDDWETFMTLKAAPGTPTPMFRGVNQGTAPVNVSGAYGNNNQWQTPQAPTPWSNLPPQLFYQNNQPQQPQHPTFKPAR